VGVREELEKEYDAKVTFPTYVPSLFQGRSNYYSRNGAYGAGSNFLGEEEEHDIPLPGSSLADQDDQKKFVAEPVSMSVLFDQYSKMTHADKEMFREAYFTWTGEIPNMTDQAVRRDYFEFCDYYNFDAEQMSEDYGYGYDWQGTGEGIR
jgi:hypothetical protein